MKSRKFNKEKYAEQKAMKKKNRPQRSYKSLGTTIEIPINHRKHKILATARHNDENGKEDETFTVTLSIAKETGDFPIWHQFEDDLQITAKRYSLRTALMAKVIELETAGDLDIHIESADAIYKLLECAGDYLAVSQIQWRCSRMILSTILIGGAVLFCAGMCRSAATREMITEDIYCQIKAESLHKNAFRKPRTEMEQMTDMIFEESEDDE